MLNRTQGSSALFLVALVLVLVPSTGFAQAAITGVVRDASAAYYRA